SGDELATPHSITSSARATSVGGSARPSACAVLRLMSRSKCVGTSSGRSAGRAAGEDAGDEIGGAFADVALLGAVRHQPAVTHRRLILEDRRQAVGVCEFDD